MKHIVNFSGGKDSTAMLLHMIELGMPIDEVINCDVGMEFPAMYTHIEKIKALVEAEGIKFTVLKSHYSYEYFLLDYQYVDNKGISQNGYGWARSKSRWCTSILKKNVIEAHLKQFDNAKILHYIGIASDETYRLKRENNKRNNHIHPLVEWQWTEADALKYCYEKGYDFGGLYEIFNRVSCWCCPLQSLAELKKLYIHFPNLWERLKVMESKSNVSFRYKESVPMLEARFNLELDREAKGLTISGHTKEFRNALKDVYSNFPSLEEQGFTRFSFCGDGGITC